ncbi:Malate dehydrogenase [Candidatus Nitrospira nitrificans]|uniref:Malate dehydrogenase n=2 Tax=Candidatus Nitrospira nitrificans TaxID=1742973 RepID=A0A0S4LAY9_9BACT|nr:malate dehydrogenase [Candidatus Nitrospira nitrificans]CUS33792.1 Malate dehydrogenase [Candidatus Nitrospira nitrificans]
MMARPKITVVGAGNVGGTTAQRLAEKDLYDVVLVDIAQGVPQGKALDISQAGPVCGYSTQVVGTNEYKDTAGSSIAVITSGMPRKPGMSRDELLATNAKIVKSVVSELVSRSPNIILILVTNPLDAMVHVAHSVSGLPKSRIIGMAGVLDSARMRTFIAAELNVPVTEVQAMVLGGHGDTMVPLPRYTTVRGRPVSELMSKEKLDAIVKRTRDGGAEIVGLLKTGSAFYAPSASAVAMVESIHKDEKQVMPCAVLCDGEYGLKNVVVGVPVKIGRGGAEQILEYELTSDERAALETSANAVRELCRTVDRLMA